jgi:hypothetical protein
LTITRKAPHQIVVGHVEHGARGELDLRRGVAVKASEGAIDELGAGTELNVQRRVRGLDAELDQVLFDGRGARGAAGAALGDGK